MPKTIQERFEAFHEENPHVYTELLNLARQAHDRGRRKFSISMLFEVCRWNRMLQTTGKPFKLSNDYRSRYARKLMDENPDLDNLFNLRELTTD